MAACANEQAGQKVQPPPGVHAYTALIQALAAAGRFPECVELLAEMKARGVQPNVVTYSTLANGFVQSGLLTEARELLQTMQARPGRPAYLCAKAVLMHFAAAVLS